MPDPEPDPEPTPSTFKGLNLKTPDRFSFVPGEWPAYKKQVERWFLLSEARNMNSMEKREALLYMMGQQADQIVTTFREKVTDTLSFKDFIKLFDDYFTPKTNLVAERGKFWDRRQKEGESNEDFICEIYNLGDQCGYSEKLPEHLRDKLCHGMSDRHLAAELRSNGALTLETVTTRMRCKESISNDIQSEKERAKESLRLVKSEVKVESLDSVSKNKKPHFKNKDVGAAAKSSGDGNRCFRCGEPYSFEHRRRCPAIRATCSNCARKGHYSKCCMQQKLKEVVQTEGTDRDQFSDDEYYTLSSVQAPGNSPWRAQVQVGRNSIIFKADPGADVTAISSKQFELLSPKPRWKTAQVTLCGPDRAPLDTQKVFGAELKFRDKVIRAKVYVVRGLEENLLGRMECVQLQLVQWNGDECEILKLHPVSIRTTAAHTWDPKLEFPECFQGLGIMPVEYKITLREGALPFVINAPRRIPHPIRDQVKAQLDQMEKDGVISEITEPTEWCAGLVPVPKASDPTKILLCVDHIQLNKAIVRERILLPSVEETLAKFAGAKIFSKLDCKDSFWQVQLHPQKDREFSWDQPQEAAFDQLKEKLASSPILCHYDPAKEHRVATDASLIGLGGVLEQLEDGEWKPVSYASRRLTETESRYAPIEREALGIVWACHKYHEFIMGKEFVVRTDHKPLVSIFGSKNLDDMTPRLQRLRLKLLPYSFTVEYVPGKEHHIPDWLSRSPPNVEPTVMEKYLIAEIKHSGEFAVESLPVKDCRLEEIFEASKDDQTIAKVIQWIRRGFPEKRGHIGGEAAKLWTLRYDLMEQDGIVLYKNRLVIPENPPGLRRSILKSLHEGHQSLSTMRNRAATAVYWPGLSSQLAEVVDSCETCCKNKKGQVEPLMSSVLPDYPWQCVVMDVAEVNNINYLVIADRYSRYPEIHQLDNLTSGTMVIKCKETFSRHGIPAEVRCDNATPFMGAPFQAFLHAWGITMITSSPRYPKSNGQAESAVKIVKKILKYSKDPYLGLLAYRNTPLADINASPAQLSMGRILRSTLPTSSGQLQPQTVAPSVVRERDKLRKEKQARNHDLAHGSRNVPPLLAGDQVWVKDLQRNGTIEARAHTPRSYIVATDKGRLRRNRIHLNKIPAQDREDSGDSMTVLPQAARFPTTNEDTVNPNVPRQEDPPATEALEVPARLQSPRRTRSGRVVRAPDKLNL
ncbi:hypothetical protein B566_EDAN015817 [Ephemera danica]|nr:hypothetical protein B566_EDAN015817 [Ephemera danica]